MSTPRWGATPEDWKLFADTLGLTADMLPVVSNPKAVVSPQSTMRELGKTPSLYNGNHQVVGIPGWTSKETTKAHINAWEKEPDYGICIRTNRIRAIDIDVEDFDLGTRIVEFIGGPGGICENVGGFPHRCRAGTGKSILAFQLDGEFPKRVLKVEGGIIEFLGNGQQFIAAGTHPKGMRYEWEWYSWDETGMFPLLTTEEFERLWKALEAEFGIEPSTIGTIRKTGNNLEIDDEIAEQLETLGTGRGGQLYIDCPWKHEHSNDTGMVQTCYFPRGTNGYTEGHFKCMHAHCAKRTNAEFIEALGLKQDLFGAMVAEPDYGNLSVAAKGEDSGRDPLDPLPVLMRDKQNKPLANVVNVRAILHRPDITHSRLAFDEFQGLPLFATDKSDWRPFSDSDYTMLRERFDRLGFAPVGREMMRDVCQLVFALNRIDTARAWLDKVPVWDGVERMDRFCADYLGAEDTPYSAAVGRYLWTAITGRIMEPGIKADMAVIFCGPQNTGKSGMCKLLAPFEEAFANINLGDSEEAIARRLRGVCVAELGELKGLANRDLETVKSIVTTSRDRWVPKYVEHVTSYPRRAIFIGTSNHNEFLADETGNRRWLPIQVTPMAPLANQEEKARGTHAFAAFKALRLQFFAEGKAKFLVEGIAHVEAEKLAKAVHARHTVTDVWSDMVYDWLYREDEVGGVTPAGRPYLKLVDVLRNAVNINSERIERRHEIRMGSILVRLGYIKKQQWVEGRNQKIWIPPDSSMN